MSVITRFAPSPTGFLHIGGARTALFNWLFAKHHGGTFLLRIEDTDKERSTVEAKQAILDGLKWLGLEWDGDEIYQLARSDRHAEVARELVAKGKAYYCYATPQELDAERKAAEAAGKVFKYDRRWRERDASEAPKDVKPVVRIKAPLTGEMVIADAVQGDVRVSAEQLDDFILLRSDGTPTYMHAVVVDDHDMNITHVIRGDDHLNNAFRQRVIYDAMGWNVPVFAHIPLIHGPDGAKLSKRHGALGVEAYRDMGYLPEALRNYLLRLGWSHGDDEIISTAQAIEWFGLDHVGRSPSRMDFMKLENTNGHYIREAENARLVELVLPMVEQILGRSVDAVGKDRLLKGMNGLKARAKTINQIAEQSIFYLHARPIPVEEAAKKFLEGDSKTLLQKFVPALEAAGDWNHDALNATAKAFADANGTKLGNLMAPIRAAITGFANAPSMFEVMEVLGKQESIERLKDAC